MQAKRKREEHRFASLLSSLKAADEPRPHPSMAKNLDPFPALRTWEEVLIEYERMHQMIVRSLYDMCSVGELRLYALVPIFSRRSYMFLLRNPVI